jgi:hypothetical protein
VLLRNTIRGQEEDKEEIEKELQQEVHTTQSIGGITSD